MIKEQEKSSQANSFERHTINLLSEYYRQKEVMPEVDKTLILYSVFDDKDAKFLCNLHAIAAGIMSQNVTLRGEINQDEETGDTERYYQTTIDEIKKAEIKVDFIKVSSKQENDFKNIRLYEGVVKGQYVRVVAVPIEKSLTNAGEASNLSTEIKNMENSLYEQTKDLQGPEMVDLRAKLQNEIDFKKLEHEGSMKDTHLRMFNIEALLHVVKEKTRVLSVSGFLGPKDKLEEKKKETKKLFNIPENATQYISHTVINKNTLPDKVNNKFLSSVWTFEKNGTVKCEKNTCFSSEFYSEQGKNIKTNIYGLMNDGTNSSLSTVIEEFNKIWNGITFNTSTCIATIISRIYELLNYGDDLSSSFSSSSKDVKTNMSISPNLTATYTFEEVFKRYDVDGNKNIRTNPESRLQEFYTAKRLSKIKPEKGDTEIIPKSIQKIAFLHYFEQINKGFCEEYTNLERTDSKRLFPHVFQHLKTIYELVKTINESFDPSKEDNQGKPSVYCENVQKYFDFLDFLLQSSNLIKSITGREFALESIKAFFDQLKPRDNKLLSYILSHEDDIKEGESLNYYDLYLLIIKESSKGAQNNFDYIYLLIHKLKADQISSRYGYSKKRSVEAIKSYSEIIYNFHKIPEGKKEKFKKLEIEKKIARLLLSIGLPEEAAKIFMKNHLVRSAEKCFKQVLLGLNGDDKAKKYIEYGKFFETEFNFAKAIEYYECAYEAARSTEKRQEAIKTKIESSTRMFNPREEMKRMFVRFYTNQCTEEDFLDTPAKLQSEQEIVEEPDSKSIFLRLRKKLKWDEASGNSVINEDISEDKSVDSI